MDEGPVVFGEKIISGKPYLATGARFRSVFLT